MIECKDFDEPLIDPCDVQGESTVSCADMAVMMFMGGVWHPLMQAVHDEAPVQMAAAAPVRNQVFKMYSRAVVRIGEANQQPFPLTEIIKDELPKYLGTKKYYWLRISLVKYKDQKRIDVRMNGSVCKTLQDMFNSYVDNRLDADDHLVMEKQFVIFVNEQADRCPFGKALVQQGAEMCLKELAEIRSPEAYRDFSGRLDEMIRAGLPENMEDAEADALAKSLACEIRVFVPEILAKLTLGYGEGDSLFLLGEQKADGSYEQTELKKTQLRSYFYIQQSVIGYLSQNPPQESAARIAANSVAFREMKRIIAEAKANGTERRPSDLYVPGTSYRILADGYRIW